MATMRLNSEAVDDPLQRSFRGNMFTWRTDIGAPFGTQFSVSVPAGSITAKDIAEEVMATGIGDIELRLRQNFAIFYHDAHPAIPRVRLSAGVGLPTGEPVDPDESDSNNAAKAAEAGLLPGVDEHEHSLLPDSALGVYNINAALGMGTTWLLADLDLWWDVHKEVVVFASSQNRVALHKSSVDMLLGPEIRGLVGVSTSAIVDWLSVSVGFELMWRGRHYEINGDEEEELLNSGGIWLSVVPTTEFRIADPISVHVGARVPLYQEVRGYQITDDWTLFAGITGTFSLSEPPSELPSANSVHPPAIAHAPSKRVDVAVRDGQAFAVADILVPNKITVIDYFADWCAPCIALGEELDVYVKENPHVVVQRVDIVDWESPAVAGHIKSEQGIPILDIYDTHGKLVQRLVQGETSRFREVIEGIGSR